MTHGPLPHAVRRRTNAPTIPTTDLPASGRKGRAPAPPRWFNLEGAALAWWRWAWRLPQACAWSDGDLAVIARRALLEARIAADGATASELAEARQLDDRLGLTPKGLAQLRWKIVAEAPAEQLEQSEGERYLRLASDSSSGTSTAIG